MAWRPIPSDKLVVMVECPSRAQLKKPIELQKMSQDDKFYPPDKWVIQALWKAVQREAAYPKWTIISRPRLD